jgi:hypothetical protein
VNLPLFLFQAFASTTAYLTIFLRFGVPYLSKRPISVTLTTFLLPNLFRHIGLATLSSQVVAPEFAVKIGPSVAVGDFLVLVTTYLALIAIWKRMKVAILLCWLFVVLGFVHDAAVTRAMLTVPFSAVDRIGSHWYVATFVVPMMVLTEILMLFTLCRRGADLKREFSSGGVGN